MLIKRQAPRQNDLYRRKINSPPCVRNMRVRNATVRLRRAGGGGREGGAQAAEAHNTAQAQHLPQEQVTGQNSGSYRKINQLCAASTPIPKALDLQSSLPWPCPPPPPTPRSLTQNTNNCHVFSLLSRLRNPSQNRSIHRTRFCHLTPSVLPICPANPAPRLARIRNSSSPTRAVAAVELADQCVNLGAHVLDDSRALVERDQSVERVLQHLVVLNRVRCREGGGEGTGGGQYPLNSLIFTGRQMMGG